MTIKTLMETKQTILSSNLNILLNHPVTKGEHCEGAWIDFFRSFLPSKYSVDKGFVFDSANNISEQIDIIIYDSLYAPLVFGTESGEKFVTAESVYAIFESKPKLTKENLEYADQKISSVISLKRTSRAIINGGVISKPRPLTRIIGGILAVESCAPETLEKNLAECKNIMLGCSINDFSFNVERDSYLNLVGFSFSSKSQTVLSFFYILLDELYKLGTVAGLDIREYANATLEKPTLIKGEV